MGNPLEELIRLGQSPWYDNIERRLLDNGELATLIIDGDIRGITSNPSIFHNAITSSNDYDDKLKELAHLGCTTEVIYDALVMADIREAADLFLPLYKQSRGGDGYVSLEVSPLLARNTQTTLSEARRLWKSVDRPNLMIKIPATREGLPAIRKAISEGININVTLIFSISRYIEVIDAYLSGLEDRISKGGKIDLIASVASFFVSRLDTKVDRYLEDIILSNLTEADKAKQLLGRMAIANAKLAYKEFKTYFSQSRFIHLKDRGANYQRPLWASTSTKNPAYSDTYYVDSLIGPNTVNTLPPKTLFAFKDHGSPEDTIEKGIDEASEVFSGINALGISVDEVTNALEEEGVQAFSQAYEDLLVGIENARLKFLQ